MYDNTAHDIYAQNNIDVESPIKLTEMLYEGVLRFNAQAKKAMKDGNVEKRVYWLNRSTSIITELISALDFKHGDVAPYLEGLYNYEIQLLVEAGNGKNVAKLDECSNVFKVLLDAWRETTHINQ